MDTEKQRIAIAVAMKLDRFHPLRYATRGGKLLPVGEKGVRLMYCEGGTNGYQDWGDVPNYPGDLNAMHKAEEWIGFVLGQDYIKNLFEIVNPEMNAWYPIIRATAAQRAEAFLRTLGKWEDGE